MIRWPWKVGHGEDLTESREALREVRNERREKTETVVSDMHEIILRNNFGDKFHRALGGKAR